MSELQDDINFLKEERNIVPIKVVINASIGINSKQKINGELK